MSKDSYRFNGPEELIDYQKWVVPVTSATAINVPKKFRRDGLRTQDDEHRPLFLKTGVISQARGSAYIEQGKTKLISAVYGPREITRRSDFSMKGLVVCELQFAPFSCHRRKFRIPSALEEERDISLVLQQVLEASVCLYSYPKSQIDVFVTVLENDGSCLAAAISCCSMALIDASIKLVDIIIGATLQHVGSHRLLDPSWHEEELEFSSETENDFGSITIGCLPSLDQITTVHFEGNLAAHVVSEDIEQLRKFCISELVVPIRNCLTESVKEKLLKNNECNTGQ